MVEGRPCAKVGRQFSPERAHGAGRLDRTQRSVLSCDLAATLGVSRSTRAVRLPSGWRHGCFPFALTFYDQLQSWALTWLPILLMAALVYLVWRTLKMMPRTKPQQIKPSSQSSIRWDDVAGCEEAKDELREVVEFLRTPERFKQPRREGAEGHPAARPARHGQDAAREGGRARVGRQLLQPVRELVRRDVRRPRRGAHPAAVRRSRRRTRRRSSSSTSSTRSALQARLRHLAREGPDAEPAAGRDGRLRGHAATWS